MNTRYLTITFFLHLSFCTMAQNDSSIVLTQDRFLEIVKKHHPVALQADIQVSKGNALLQSSRGGFDPKLFADYNQKYYADKSYYGLLNGGLKIPTWFGLEVKTGIERNDGQYLNPEHTVPESGLWYAGVSLPVGQGLFIDKRRAELRKAEIYQKSSLIDRQLILNELLYYAGKTYWDWFIAHENLLVYENALNVAQERFDAVKQSALLGDNPPIDTLEAGIQVQTRRLGFQQASLEYQNATALLEVYLWLDGTVPLELDNITVPTSMSDVVATEIDGELLLTLDTFITGHPKLKHYQLDIDQLSIEKRLKKEMLKPEFDLNYFALSEPIGNDPLYNLSTNNYKWGLEFSMPLLLRKERGDLKLADLKIEEKTLDLSNEQALISFNINASLNHWNTSYDQVQLYLQTVRDYLGLLEGERRLFESGESSLFMINSREMGYIQAQLKLIELLGKNKKAGLQTFYYLGNLGQE